MQHHQDLSISQSINQSHNDAISLILSIDIRPGEARLLHLGPALLQILEPFPSLGESLSYTVLAYIYKV